MIQNEFWRGKRVLVTGHTGFVGCWLTMALVELGAEVTGFSLPPEEGALYAKVEERLSIRSVYGDLRNHDEIRRALEACEPEIIFHLAAFGFVKECHEDPLRAYSTNVDGTLNLLEAIKACKGLRSIIVASSDKVYLNHNEDKLFTEEDNLGGLDPYSASKTCEDILARSCYESYLKDSGAGMCIVRPSNILGGGDHHENRLIPGIFRAQKNREAFRLRHPEAVRPWQSVLDMLDAYLLLARSSYGGAECSVYNVGPKKEDIRSTREIFGIISGFYGGNAVAAEQEQGGSAAVEHTFLGLSIEKIYADFGWEPRCTLAETLRNVYECYEAGDKIYDVCLRQISSYFTDNRWGEL